MTRAPTATALAAVFHGPGELRLEEVEVLPPGPGELLIRITACGLCTGEIMDWYVARKAPVPLGHEPVGVVVEAGSGTAFRAGERVFVHHHAPCMSCRACLRGDHVHCSEWAPRRLIPGGLATLALAQAPAVATDTLRLPQELSDDAATFVEPLACVLKSIRRARIRDGDRVLVVGMGVMGLLHLLALRAVARPSVLIGADPHPARAAIATRYADVVADTSRQPLSEVVREATGGNGADVAVVGPGTVEALEAGRSNLAAGGTLLVFAPTPPEARWPLPVHDIYFKEITITPAYSAGPQETREALDLLTAGLRVEPLVTHRLPLSEAGKGYRLLREGGSALKVVVRP